MYRFQSLCIPIAHILISLCGFPDQVEAHLSVGASKVDISPLRFPVIRNGGFLEASEERLADPLHARCLVMDSGAKRIAIVVIDSCMIPRELCDAIKNDAAVKLGLSPAHILISATHTHSAPSVMNYCLGSRSDPGYKKQLPPKVIDGLKTAIERLRPARVGWVQVDAGHLTYCRRWITRLDQITEDPFGQRSVRANMHPGYENLNYVGPSGPKDPWLSLVYFQSLDGKPLAVLGNFSMHYFGGQSGLSADYAGLFSEGLAQHLASAPAEFVGILSQGTSGDLMWMNYGEPRTLKSIEEYTSELIELAVEALEKVRFEESLELDMMERRLVLSRRLPDQSRLKWAKDIIQGMGNPRPRNLQEVYAEQAMYLAENPEEEVVLQVIRLGELGITAMPNEVYGITGLKIKQRSPLPTTFNIGLANGASGYIPPLEQHALGGYTTWPARTAGLEVGAEAKIVETLLSMLSGISGRSPQSGREPANEYSLAVMDSKPRAYWRLGESEGKTAEDWSGHESHASFRGRIAYHLPGVEFDRAGDASSYKSRAVHLAGGSIEATVPTLGSTFSIELWIWNGLPPSVREVTASIFTHGKQRLCIAGWSHVRPGILNYGELPGKTKLSLNRWHHLVFTKDKNYVRIYLDGNKAPDLEGRVLEESVFDANIVFGDSLDHLAPLEGKFDEVAIYDRVLSAEEIARHFAMAAVALPSSFPVVAESIPGSSKPSLPEDMRRLASAILASKPVLYLPLVVPSFGVEFDEGSGPSRWSFEEDAGLRQAGSGAPNFRNGRLKIDDLPLKGSYAVELWFRNERASHVRPVTGYLISRGIDDAPAASGDHLGIGGTHSSAGRLFLFNGNRLYHERAGRTVIRPGTWNHVIFCRDEDRVVVYLNGDPEPEIEALLEPTFPPDPTPVFIGGRNDRFANFQGMIDQVSIYDRPLTSSEVVDHYQASGILTQSNNAASSPELVSDLIPLSPRQSMSNAHVADGYVLELMAAEPMVQDPVAIDWGPDGTLWVAEMADYPYGMDGQGKPGGRIRRLSDTDLDGLLDSYTIFLEDLNFPTSVMAWRGGVLVTAAPDLFYAEDTDGDGRADRREVLFTGFMQGNQQLRVNSLRWGLDNWVYAASGGHHAGFGKSTKISAPSQGAEFNLGSRDFRFDPVTLKLEPRSGPSQFGRVRDDWGNWFGVQNSFPLWHYVVDDHYLSRNAEIAAPDPRRHLRLPPNPKVYPQTTQKRFHSFEQSGRFTSACGPTIYRDDLLFPQGNVVHAFTCEPFHNVVQHHHLRRDGISFQGARAEKETELDFFASADRWSRPVMARTGPDGALWIVDMYRYMIEHPDWLPQEGKDELRPHYRSGENYGRIYRIYPEGRKPHPIRDLTKLSDKALVQELTSRNGPTRDVVHRLLLERSIDDDIKSEIAALAKTHQTPKTRLQALCLLDGLDALSNDLILAALADEHFSLRIHALRIMDERKLGDSSLVGAALKLVHDEDAQVRLQLVCNLGGWSGPEAGAALVHLAKTAPDDSLFHATVLGSTEIHFDVFAKELLADSRYAPAIMAMALKNDARLAFWLSHVLPPSQEAGVPTQESFESMGHWMSLLKESGRSLSDILSTRNPRLLEVVPSIRLFFQTARRVGSDSTANSALRQSAMLLFGHETDAVSTELDLLKPLLSPRHELDLQLAAIRALARMNRDEATAGLLDHWPQSSPEARALIVKELLTQTKQIHRLLHALDEGLVSAVDISASQRQQLLKHPNKAISVRAATVFAFSEEEDRGQILRSFRPALELAGRPDKGSQYFHDRCSSCHQLGDIGTAIGPDLRSITDLSEENLLTAVLDPSRNVEPKYLGYTAVLNHGELVYGLIQSETGNSLVFQLPDGSHREILRTNIQSLNSSKLSFMPDGLTEGMNPQDMADLIAFIQESLKSEL